MADIRVINILPPQPVQNVTQSQVAGGDAPKINVVNFPVGSVLSGFIINRDVGGNPILRTENGDITFASQIFLKIGSEVTIRIEHIAGNTAAHLLTVNGQEPELAAVQSAFAQEPEVIISGNLGGGASVSVADKSAVSNQPLPPNSQPQIINTQVTGKVIAPIITAENTPIVPTGTQISFKVLSVVNSVGVGDKPATISQPLNPNPQTQNPINAYTKTAVATPSFTTIPTIHSDTNISTATPTNQNSEIIPNDAVFAARPPTTNNQQLETNNQKPATIPPQIGNQLTATVLQTEPNGEAIVQTPIGLVRVNLSNQSAEKIAVGSEITFEIKTIETPEKLVAENAALATAQNASVAITPAPITQLARSAGALSDIFSLLTGFGSSSALDFVENKIPSISLGSFGETGQVKSPASFPAALLGFAVALKNGDFREWLGRANAKWLEENGHETLLKKAEGEFLSLSRQFVDAPQNSWQSLFFPVAVEGVLQQARLFVKRDKKEKTVDGEKKTEEDTRFVVEMDLTNLGQMQMDGFVRRNAQKTQFDLIIRSHQALSKEAQQDILQIYNDTGAITGYSGSIIFQTSKDFPVNPMEEITSGKHEGFLA